MALDAMLAPGASRLDQPPPSPDLMPQSPETLAGLAPPVQLPAGMMPPEVLTGVLQWGQQVQTQFDAVAQISPDLALDWSLLKMSLQRILQKLQLAGGGAVSPTATGPAFSGGGIDRGSPLPGA